MFSRKTRGAFLVGCFQKTSFGGIFFFTPLICQNKKHSYDVKYPINDKKTPLELTKRVTKEPIKQSVYIINTYGI